MDASWLATSEESQGGEVWRQGHGHRLLGRSRCDPRRLPSEGRTINGEYNADLLRQLRDEIKRSAAVCCPQVTFFIRTTHQSTSLPWSCPPFMTVGYRYALLQHPPYSPDLAPSDYDLFPRMKNLPGRTTFRLGRPGDRGRGRVPGPAGLRFFS